MPQTGLYESLITEALAARISGSSVSRAPLHEAEAADRLSLHVAGVLERAIASLSPADRVAVGAALAATLIDQIVAATAAEALGAERPVAPAEMLRSVLSLLPDGRPETIGAPLIPLLDTTLVTNAPGEPRVGNQVLAEIDSADRIDVVMAFIRRTGIQPMLDALRLHCSKGRSARVLTTTYTGSTEVKALDALVAAGVEVRVSYDVSTTRLHAKAWLFHRNSGFGTAYIGSSNLTHSAQISGLEWNVRVAGARNPSVVAKVGAVFESYWNSGDFVPYDREEFLRRTAENPHRDNLLISPIELRPEPFQERLLEQLAVARAGGHHRNLLVAATGTGKTVMAALDYLALRESLPRARLLFVAHRAEILTQTLALFRHALRDHGFGELWVQGERPDRFEHVFASIQSLHANGLDALAADHFDVVIVDEFHHAAADSYRVLLERVAPRELLGLTATPERSDGSSVLDWFDGRIAAELRLWDAIDRQFLVPFAYYGIHDGLDLREVPWKRGRGYDIDGLTQLYTGNDAWARFVVKEVAAHVDATATMRALGFCVSVDHARFMARVFTEAGIPAVAIWANTPAEERRGALRDLAARKINAVFSVDLFNEGVDVPAVDTLLFLRPTESATLFLQQLGRGLRRSTKKTVCTVLDFVGQHRAEFRFDRKLRALLGGSRKDLEAQIEAQFPYLPAGCHMELDRKASEIILKSVKGAIPNRWATKVEELRTLSRGGDVTLASYLAEAGLDLEDLYEGDKAWSDLREAAGLPTFPKGPYEVALRRACGRLLHLDDRPRLARYGELLAEDAPPVEALPIRDQRYLRMLAASLLEKAATKTTTLREGADLLKEHPQVRAELRELFSILSEAVTHVGSPFSAMPNVPLTIHGRYTRAEIIAAFGDSDSAKVARWQKGIRWFPEHKTDLLAFTLDKTVGQFSPTTRYRDYAISRTLIHWESQSVTREASETGRRYQEHEARGSTVLLFARLRSDERAFYFLGPASYVSHEGEMPMAITWRLHHPLPADLFATFAAAVA